MNDEHLGRIRKMLTLRKTDVLQVSTENQLLSALGADLCRRCDLNLTTIEHNVQSYCDTCWNHLLWETL